MTVAARAGGRSAAGAMTGAVAIGWLGFATSVPCGASGPGGDLRDAPGRSPAASLNSRAGEGFSGELTPEFVQSMGDLRKRIDSRELPPGARSLGTAGRQGVDERFIAGAKKQALWILGEAAQGATGNWPELLQRTAGALEAAKVRWPEPGEDLGKCREKRNTYAYASSIWPFGGNTINLCARIAHRPGIRRELLAQIFIHEAVHLLSGYSGDECAATAVEVYAMERSGEGLASDNAYMADCPGK